MYNNTIKCQPPGGSDCSTEGLGLNQAAHGKSFACQATTAMICMAEECYAQPLVCASFQCDCKKHHQHPQSGFILIQDVAAHVHPSSLFEMSINSNYKLMDSVLQRVIPAVSSVMTGDQLKELIAQEEANEHHLRQTSEKGNIIFQVDHTCGWIKDLWLFNPLSKSFNKKKKLTAQSIQALNPWTESIYLEMDLVPLPSIIRQMRPLPHLRRLRLSVSEMNGETFVDAMREISYFSELEALSIHKLTNQLLMNWTPDFPNLLELELGLESYEELSQNRQQPFPSLERVQRVQSLTLSTLLINRAYFYMSVGYVQALRKLPHLRNLHLTFCKFEKRTTKLIMNDLALEEIQLSFPSQDITNEELQSLTSISTSLRKLNMTGVYSESVSAVLDTITGQHRLRELFLGFCAGTELALNYKSIQKIAQESHSLIGLNILSWEISSIESMDQLTGLEWLLLWRNGLQAEAILTIKDLTGLKYLDISDNFIADGEYRHLARLTNLTGLTLGSEKQDTIQKEVNWSWLGQLQQLQCFGYSNAVITHTLVFSLSQLYKLTNLTLQLKDFPGATTIAIIHNQDMLLSALRGFAKNSRLRDLQLQKTVLNDQEAYLISRLSRVKTMRLREISVAATQYVRRMSSMRRLVAKQQQQNSTDKLQMSLWMPLIDYIQL